MSTNAESGNCAEEHTPLPPEWEARPGYELLRAAVYAPPERHEWINCALTSHVSEIEFVQSLEELADADADLVLLTHEALAAGPEELRLEITRRWREEPGPLWVIIDAPERARVTYQVIGADIAVDFGTTADELSARLHALIRRAQNERDRSPLTGLPGNIWLRRYIEAKLSGGETIALVSADIDDFKAHNDRYGSLAGDDLIVLLAEVLGEEAGASAGFLAHVGGDDFCVVCSPEQAERLARAVEAGFERAATELAAEPPPAVTVVSTSVSPDEGEGVRRVFERLAALRQAERKGRDRGLDGQHDEAH
jgi:diguanylate cyclase (GGDEF)-like protein